MRVIKLFGKKVDYKKARGIKKFFGLMFKSKNTQALLFKFEKNPAIHSFFVFFEFYAVWLDKNMKVVEVNKVMPFSFIIKPKKKAKYLLEIPKNKHYSEIIKVLDEKL